MGMQIGQQNGDQPVQSVEAHFQFWRFSVKQ